MPLLAEFDDHGSYGSEDVNPISAQEKLISQHYQQNHGYQFYNFEA